MAKKKVYAVKKGRQTGLFYNWDECRRMVHGFPGAVYKSFETKQEAEEIGRASCRERVSSPV